MSDPTQPTKREASPSGDQPTNPQTNPRAVHIDGDADAPIVTGDHNILNITNNSLPPLAHAQEEPRKNPLKHPKLEKLFGREAEQARLEALCHAVYEEKSGQLLFVTAEYGFGRRALLEWLDIQTYEWDYQVLTTRVHERDNPQEKIGDWRNKAIRFNSEMVVVILEDLPTATPNWYDALKEFIKHELHEYNLLLIVSLHAHQPLKDLPEEDEETALPIKAQTWARQVLQDGLAQGFTWIEEMHLGRLSYEDLRRLTGTADARIRQRLYQWSEGKPHVALSQWQRLKELGLIEWDETAQGWRIADEAQWQRDWSAQLDELVRERLAAHNAEAMGFDFEQTARILSVAAREGEIFTLEAVAAYLGIADRDALEDFVHKVLLPQETDGALDKRAILEVQGDQGDSSLTVLARTRAGEPTKWVNRYRFARADDYQRWRRHAYAEAVDAWQLAQLLATLYAQHSALVVDTLAKLGAEAGRLAELDQLLPSSLEEQRYRAEQLRAAVWAQYEQTNLHRPTDNERHSLVRLANRYITLAYHTTQPKLWADAAELGRNLRYFAMPLTDRELLATFLNNMGTLLWAMGDYAGARPYYEEALQIRRTVLGDQHPDTASSLNNMGALLRGMGDLAGARPYYEEALRIWRTVLGDQHPNTATSLNNMGYLLINMGDLAGARPYVEEALQIKRTVLGDQHPSTANSLNNMGALLEAMGDLAGARPYVEEAVTIAETILGSEHPHTKIFRNNLQSLLPKMNQS